MQLLHDALVYRIERLQDAIPITRLFYIKVVHLKINSLQKILSNHYLQINALRFQWDISVYTKQQHYFMDRIGNIILRLNIHIRHIKRNETLSSRVDETI